MSRAKRSATMLYGYARCSTNNQDLTSQIEELKHAGCVKIHAEKISGARSNRPELQKLIRRAQHGDTIVVSRIDRLARSTLDLLSILDTLSKRQVLFRSIHDPVFDTPSPHGQLIITILGALATFERHLIQQRTTEGRKRAKQRGLRFGRPPKLNAHQRQEAIARLEAGETQADVARTFAVDRTTIGRLSTAQ